MEKQLLNRLNCLEKNFQRVSFYKESLDKKLSELESEENSYKYKIELRQKESEIFKRWLEDSLEKSINSMADVSTSALKHIIYDQNLNFKILQEPKYNRIAMKFILEDSDSSGITQGDPVSSYGGGAAVVISLVLRLAIMARLKMANLLLLDESMVALNNAYVPSAASFLRQISEEIGINILMVTHNSEFLSHAHVSYEGYKDSSLKLKKIKSSFQDNEK